MHTAISSHTPPGQGDLGRETVVGSTPSTPMMAHITKWEPSSLPFPHAYTLLRCCRRPPSASSGGAIPSAVVHVRAELFARARPAAIGRQVRRARAPPARTSCRTHTPGRPFGASRLSALTLHAEHSLQHSCLPLCAGSKLNIYPLLPERAAASLAGAGVLHAPMRLVGALAQPTPLTSACAPQDRARLPERHPTSPGGFDAFSL